VEGVFGEVFAGGRHVDPDDGLCQEAQFDFAIFTVEGDVVTILFVRANIAHNGIGMSGIDAANEHDDEKKGHKILVTVFEHCFLLSIDDKAYNRFLLQAYFSVPDGPVKALGNEGGRNSRCLGAIIDLSGRRQNALFADMLSCFSWMAIV